MTVVELDDAPPERPAAARRPRARLPWLLAAAGVVVALVTAQLVLDARERARLAGLADVPGVLAPLDGPPRTLWTVAADAEGDQPSWPTEPVAGTTVVVRRVAGDRTVRGMDARTGEVRWSTPLPLEPGASPALPPATWCEAVGRSGVVRCESQFPAGTRTVTTSFLLDLADGRLLRQVDGAEQSVVAGDLLVVGTSRRADTDVAWTLAAQDPRTGEQVWSTSLPAVRRVERVNLGSQVVGVTASLVAAGGRVMLTESGHVTVLAPDGAVERTIQVGLDGWTTLTPDGTVGWSPYGAMAPAPRLWLPDGTQVDADGYPVTPDVDDGSAPGLLWVEDSDDRELVVMDAATGRTLWRAPATTAPVVLDGTVYAGTATGAAAWDARTGRQRWRTEVGRQAGLVVTDGRSLLVLSISRHWFALGLTDGARRWDAQAAPPLDTVGGGGPLQRWDRYLLAGDGSTVVVQG